MSWGAIGGAAASAVVGSALGGGGGGGSSQTRTQSTNAQPFNVQGGLFDIGFNGNNQLSLGDNPLSGGIGAAQNFLSQSVNNPNAALAGQLGGDFLGQLQGFDPMTLAAAQFDVMSPLLQDQFNQDNLNMESRQFAQGRLGSTAGGNDFNALFDSQNDARRQLLFDSYNQGLAGQQQLFNMGSGLSQLDPQLRGLFGQLAGNSLNLPLAFQQSQLNGAQIGGALAGANTSGTLTNPGQSLTQQVGSGLVNSGVTGLTSGINGLFQPTVTPSPTVNLPNSAAGGI